MPEVACGSRPTIRECRVPDMETATLEELDLYKRCLSERLNDANRRVTWLLCMMGEGEAPTDEPAPPTGGEAGWGALPWVLGGATALGLILWKGMKKWRR